MKGFNKRHTITRSQANERSARRARKPGGRLQRKGVLPTEHRLPENPAFAQMPTAESGLAKAIRDVATPFPRNLTPEPAPEPTNELTAAANLLERVRRLK